MAEILIGLAEALPAAEVFFSLRAAGHTVSVFQRDTSTLPLTRHLPVQNVHRIPAPETDLPAAVAAMQTLARSADLVLPLDDPGLWLADTALTGRMISAGATGAPARIALDKRQQIDAARQAGLAVPDTLVVTRPEDLTRANVFPAIAKPSLALADVGGKLSKGDTHFLANASDRDSLVARLTSDMAPMLVQPLIRGRGTGIFGLCTEDGVVAWSGHERLRMMNPHGSGSSACRARQTEPDLREGVSLFLQVIGWRGPFMMEFLTDADGTDWFMELNGRMWGSLALARRQGLEYPAWAVELAQDPTFKPTVPARSEVPLEVRHLGRDLLQVLFTLRGPKSDFHRQDWPSLSSAVTGALRPGRGPGFYNFDPEFPRYYIRDALHTVRKTIGKARS